MISLTQRALGAIGLLALALEMANCAAAEPNAVAFSDEDRAYWAFQPVRRPAVPRVRQAEWVRNSIDAFVLARLETAAIGPSREADRRMLIRRVTFDLHGLPPTPAEVNDFLADSRPGAYERLIDRLLASPRYGERWGRHWLDLVRYAESDGYNQDAERPHAWRYRDYVINAVNADKPYDRFIAEQVAGDELAAKDPRSAAEALAATGFLRHGPRRDGAGGRLAPRAGVGLMLRGVRAGASIRSRAIRSPESFPSHPVPTCLTAVARPRPATPLPPVRV